MLSRYFRKQHFHKFLPVSALLFSRCKKSHGNYGALALLSGLTIDSDESQSIYARYFGHIAQCSTRSGPKLRKEFNFIADVVEKSAEAVVYIEIVDSRRLLGFHGKPVSISNGSGFIVASDGLILTNAHVVMTRGATTVQVKLLDGRIFTGKVESYDMHSDLATVRIDAKNLPTMPLGTSSDLRPGEWVVAIGSPLSLSNTITAGVVSAPQRPSTELGIYNKEMNYIQTDASITFGNSGGPLVNLDGEAVGINTIKVTPGISFAIPIDYAKEFLKRSSDKRVFGEAQAVKKFVGVTLVTLRPDFVELLQSRGILPEHVNAGILVWRVIKEGPAFLGGLRPGDIVTHINGKLVTKVQDFYDVLEASKKISLRIVRDGETLELTIVPETE